MALSATGTTLNREFDTLSLPLSGSVALSCGLCVDRLREAVEGVEGVRRVDLNSSTAMLTVAYDPATVSGGTLEEEARRVANRIASQFDHRTYHVSGMDCAHCAEGLEQMARGLPGVVSASVSFSAAKMRVEFDTANSAGISQLPQRAKGMGFPLTEADSARSVAPEVPATPLSRLFSPMGRAIISSVLLALGLLLEHAFHAPEAMVRVAYGLSILLSGWRFALAGLVALRERVLGTNLLMALAGVGALIIGHWEEAAMVVTLYAIGVALEGAAMERTRRSLRALVDARPPEALVQRPNLRQETVPAESLVVGDVMVVKPGAKLAADGVIVSGSSAMNEAAITGESVPADKKRGDTVFAGSVNGNGSLLVRVTAPAADSTLARLLHLVEEAQAQKAPTQAFVERFGRIYTPLVLVVALFVGFVGPLVIPGIDWTYRALTLLVVSCPCALVIATPVAYVSAIARAARGGVLVKGGAYLESLASARKVYMDKTGTITTGQVSVAEVVPVTDGPDATNQLLALAASVERHSEHPLARAVVNAAERDELSIAEATDVVALPGVGVTATVGGQTVLVGKASLLKEQGISVPESLSAKELELAGAGRTILFVASGGAVQGLIAVADTVRPEAAEAIAELKRRGREVAILTGDNPLVARTVGAAVGITDIRASLLPQDKLAAVREGASTGKGVIFVGDGINDAPALAASTVGVAMGSGGTAAALEAADLALMRDELTRLPWAVRLAEVTQGIVRFNIAVAVAAVVLLLGATLSGSLSLPLGVLGHEGSALLVILNGVRLLSPKGVMLFEADEKTS